MPTHPTMRVLIVDDEPINRQLISEILSGAGQTVELAVDGIAALELAGSVRFDLVLMDVRMPRMDGLEATRALRKMPGYALVPIVGISANADPQDRARCLGSGMDDLVAKPSSVDSLLGALAGWLDEA